MIDAEIRAAAQRIVEDFTARQLTVATAESCTGGLVAGALDRNSRLIGGRAVRLRHLFERGQATDARRAERCAGSARRGQPRDGARNGERRTRPAPTRRFRLRSPELPDRAAARQTSRSVLFNLLPPNVAAATITREMRFGDIGRSEVRRRSVFVALEMLGEVAAVTLRRTPSCGFRCFRAAAHSAARSDRRTPYARSSARGRP